MPDPALPKSMALDRRASDRIAPDGTAGSGNVLIYRDRLLPYSETFIPAQVEAMERYRGHYVGVSRVEQQGLALPEDRLVLLDEQAGWPRLERSVFRLLGHSPSSFLRQLRLRSPRLIHAHFGLDAVFATHLAKQLQIPLIVTFHGYDAALKLSPEQLARTPLAKLKQFWRHRGSFYQQRYVEQRSLLFQQASRVIAVSNCVGQLLVDQGCPPHKVQVHYLGIDRHHFRPDPQLSREAVVLFVGRLVEKKGCGALLRAMVQVQRLHPEVRLVVIGDGPLRRSLEQQAQETLKSYEFLGVQPPSVVHQWMNRARIFCVPSQRTATQDVEGLGMVFAEAQAMGLPVVSYASGGVPEVVRQGETGLLAAEGDINALGQALHRLLSEQDLWEKMAIAGPKYIAQNFDLHRNTPQLEAIYDEILTEVTLYPPKP